MQGSRHVTVTQRQAWDSLNDPEVLKVCIPGCDRIESTGEGQFAIGLSVKVGPVAARFNGRIALCDVQPPESYSITFEGQGGAAGFGKGSARVRLSPDTEGTCEIEYHASAQVGGKLAQVGQRLVDGVARSMAEDFFRRLHDEMQRRYPQAEPAAPEAVASDGVDLVLSQAGDATFAVPAATKEASHGSARWVWAGLALSSLVVLVVFAIGR